MPTLKEERRLFFLVWFIFAVTSWHARQNFARQHPARAQAATEPAEAFVSRVVLSLLRGGAGGLVEDHNVSGTIYSAQNIVVSRSSCVRGHYLLTVNMYFFISMIPKILTEFSFGIGMVITEKFRPIPTEKYRLDTTLKIRSLTWGIVLG